MSRFYTNVSEFIPPASNKFIEFKVVIESDVNEMFVIAKGKLSVE